MATNNKHHSANPFSAEFHSDKEHEAMLRSLKLAIKHGPTREFLKYLVKHFGVGQLPEPMVGHNDLRMDMIGFSRAGNSIFEIMSQADATEASLILAETIKEKYNVD